MADDADIQQLKVRRDSNTALPEAPFKPLCLLHAASFVDKVPSKKVEEGCEKFEHYDFVMLK